jgi:virulence-associated protein VagC
MRRSARVPAVHRAKLFRTGGSQAVRLPKECRLPGDEALVRKVGENVVLTPIPRAYSAKFRELLLGPPRRLVNRGRRQRVDRKDLFE